MGKKGTGLAGELGISRQADSAAYMREYRKRNRERLNAKDNAYHHKKKVDPAYRAMKRKSELKQKFNLSVEEYEHLLTQQENKCVICECEFSDTVRPTVDHNHVTREVRGLLCSACNRAMGFFKDDPKLLRQAAEYLLTRGSYHKKE